MIDLKQFEGHSNFPLDSYMNGSTNREFYLEVFVDYKLLTSAPSLLAEVIRLRGLIDSLANDYDLGPHIKQLLNESLK